MSVLWLLTVELVSGQSLEATFGFAETQFKEGRYQEAIKVYHRVLFFDRQEGRYATSVYERMGDCYRLQQNYKEAAHYYDLAYYNHPNDSAQAELALKKSASVLLGKGFDYALVDLLQLPPRLQKSQELRKNLYLGIAYYGLEDFEKAEQYLLAAVDSSDREAYLQIQQEFSDLHHIRLNPKKARILSMIIPGLGQFYAGDVKNGLNSFLLCSAWVVLGAVIVRNYTLWDGVLTAIPWYQRYYLGGVEKAEEIATRKLRKKRSAIYENLLVIVSSSQATP